MNQAEIKRRQTEEIAGILTLVMIFVMGKRMETGGITYMSAAVYVCFLAGALASGGLADTLGKMLRSRRNKGQYKNILTLRKSALLFQGILGLACAAALVLLACAAAEGVFRIRYCTFLIMALSPVVLLRTVSAVLQGYFQGEAAELPRAFSGIARQLLTLGFGLLFTGMLGDYGEKVSSLLREPEFAPMYRCLGLCLAICLAEVLVILFLAVLFKGSRRRERRMQQEGVHAGDSAWDCIRNLCMGRWSHSAAIILGILPLAVGLALSGRGNPEEAGALLQYDIYVERYFAVCCGLVFVLSFLALPVTGKVFQSLRREEGRFARTVFLGGVHMGVVQGVFFSVFAAVMGTRISACLGGDGGELAGQMLRAGSSVVALVSLSLYFGRFLQGVGKKYMLPCALCLSDAAFLLLLFITVKSGILSLVYAGVVLALVLCGTLGFLSFRQLRIRMDWLGMLVIPLLAGGAAGLVCMLSDRLFSTVMGDLPILLVSFLFSGIVYLALLLVLRNFREQEFEILPGGRILNKIGQMLHRY